MTSPYGFCGLLVQVFHVVERGSPRVRCCCWVTWQGWVTARGRRRRTRVHWFCKVKGLYHQHIAFNVVEEVGGVVVIG